MAKRSSTRKTTTKKKTTSRSASAAAKKTSRKKTTAKKTATAARKAASRKKKTASAGKKTTAKKAPSKKKTTTKKKSPVANKTTAPARSTKKKAGGKKPARAANTPTQAPATKKKRKRSKTAGGSRSLGARSVAEAASAAKADDQGYVYINGRRVRMISTKGQAPAKKTRTAKPVPPPDEEAPKAAKPVRTKLSARELRHFRDLLLLKRAELVGDLSAMQEAALQARGGNLSNLPIHMADIGTDTFDQDFMLGLAETERQRLREIDDALMRIEGKTYGVCQMTGKPIPKARLNAKPWAKYTIEAARQLEGQWRP